MSALSIPELLAPAGERDAAYAAYEYGADAVYLGLARFSARADAVNFSLSELADLVGFAHSLSPSRRVYVTLNTLLLERELPEVIDVLMALREMGVDALIVQDLAVVRLVREHVPALRLHASTQMAIHSRDGLTAIRPLGVRRAVLARELTLAEIRQMAAVAGIETEVFVHGALCYGYSGLCLLSSHVCGRSGNRGRCAYLCRKPFRCRSAAPSKAGAAAKAGGLLFSMKDLAVRDIVKELAGAGVSALKIEGRMKTPRYVAATTCLYRRLLDGGLSRDEQLQIEGDIATIFSRPRTRFFSRGRNAGTVVSTSQIGHLGCPIGRVERIVRTPAQPDCLRFRVSNRELERHDGLQVAVSGRARAYGFAASELWHVVSEGRTREFSAPVGTLVDVALPGEHPSIDPGTQVYCSSSMAVKRRYGWSCPKPGAMAQRLPLRVDVAADSDRLVVSASTQRPGAEAPVTARVTLDGPFPVARTAGQLNTALNSGFSRLGDTAYKLDALTATGDLGRFVPISRINAVRRETVSRLNEKLDAERRCEAARVVAGLKTDGTRPAPATELTWHVKVDRIAYAEDVLSVACPDELILDISRDPRDAIESFLTSRGDATAPALRLALPTVVRAWERDQILARISALLACGCRCWQVAGFAGLGLLREASGGRGTAGSLDVTADWPLYVSNHVAAKQLVDVGFRGVALSPEAGLNDLRDLFASLCCPAELIVYQDTPLCVSEVCQGSARDTCEHDCDACPDSGSELVLSSDATPDLLALQDKGRTIVLSAQPMSFSGRLSELTAIGASCLRVDFIWRRYSSAEVRDVWARLRADRPVDNTHTANLDRGLE